MITDESGIKSLFHNFFSELYSTNSVLSFRKPEQTELCFKTITSDHDTLISIPSESKICLATFNLSPFKSPGPDGIHAFFYQKFWEHVKDSTTGFIQHVFQNLSIPEGINHTFMCLIPKCDFPEAVKNFRPISLCNNVQNSFKIVG